MKWKGIITITLGAPLLGAAVLAQTATPPISSTGSSAGASHVETIDPTKAPVVQPGTPIPSNDATNAPQPGGTTSGTDSGKTATMSSGSSHRSRTMNPDPTKTSSPRKVEHVRSVQEALKVKGYDPGPVDGVFGPKTRTALREFQKAENLPESGRQDAETMAKLGVQ